MKRNKTQFVSYCLVFLSTNSAMDKYGLNELFCFSEDIYKDNKEKIKDHIKETGFIDSCFVFELSRNFIKKCIIN